MSDIRTDYPLKSLNQNPSIGIGITTYRRPDILAQCLAGFKKYMPPNSTLFVNDDSERNEGISASKNCCLAALENCDYIFLFDDGIWPAKNYWWVPFILGANEHNCHVFSSSCDVPYAKPGMLGKEGTLCNTMWVCGVCVFLTKQALNKIGGYNTVFGRWGGEREEYAQRAWLNGLAPQRLCDIDGSLSYFYSVDKETMDESSFMKLYRTPQTVIKAIMRMQNASWQPYKAEHMYLLEEGAHNPHVLRSWLSKLPEHSRVIYPITGPIKDTIEGVSYIDTRVQGIAPYCIKAATAGYVNGLTIVNPAASPILPVTTQCTIGTLGLSAEQPWLGRISNLEPATGRIVTPAYYHIPKDNVLKQMTQLQVRLDNPLFLDMPLFFALNTTPPPTKKPVYVDMRPVVMILGCQKYRESMLVAKERFASTKWHTVLVEGGAPETTYLEETGVLSLAVSDIYDALPLKVYKAFMWIAERWPNAVGIFKTDEDIVIVNNENLEYNIIKNHTVPYWGIHRDSVTGGPLGTLPISKMEDKTGGKFYPAAQYCWGAGYYVSRAALELMRENEADYASQHLEDVCTGSVLNKYGITPIPVPMRYIEADRDLLARGEVKLQADRKLDYAVWGVRCL